MIREAERFLKNTFNVKQLRVRLHENNLGRIEFLPADLPKVLTRENMITIKNKLKKLGFTYVTVDIEGFRSGSMNEALNLDKN